MSWRNNHSLEKVSPISAVDSFYNPETKQYIVIMGDESGMVKIQDLSIVIDQYNLEPTDFVTGNTKRNPHRLIAAEEYALDNHSPDGDNNSEDGGENQAMKKEEAESNLKGGDITCINAF